MDREDKRLREIDTAAENFIAFDSRDTSFPEADQEFFMSCFGAGAQWADRNPQSPWISVEEDLPYNHEELKTAKYETKKVFVLKDSFGNPDTDYMLKENGKWRWFAYNGTKYWMPVPEIPKDLEIMHTFFQPIISVAQEEADIQGLIDEGYERRKQEERDYLRAMKEEMYRQMEEDCYNQFKD